MRRLSPSPSPLRLDMAPHIIDAMGLRDTLETAHRTLEAAAINHALIGGLGLAMLGIHRATFDVDLLIDGKEKAKAKAALETAGWKLAMETEEVMHFDGRGRVDFLLANRPLGLEMLMESLPSKTGIKCVSAEGIIGLKIQAYKNDSERELQDKADIKALIDSDSNLDWKRIKKYADLFGEWPFVQSLRKKK